jgi:hypothetical protein
MDGANNMKWLQNLGNKILQKPVKNDKRTHAETKSDRTTRKKTEKELATERGEPYVAIVGMDINPDNLHEGAFELDWNDKFIANLVRAGYQMQPNEADDIIVDRWFQNVCRHVVMETWEQEEAIKKSGIYVQTRDIGDGRSEVS